MRRPSQMRRSARTSMSLAGILIGTIVFGCSGEREPQRAPYVPVQQVEAQYGRLVSTANYPSPDQYGTGERLGIFEDKGGTLWGLPITVDNAGSVRACAPDALRDSPLTDTVPMGMLVGATNTPTGWRGGTGKLELAMRDAGGQLRWYPLSGRDSTVDPACWAQVPPGPKQRLPYYRVSIRR
jgi:hypothetical protein